MKSIIALSIFSLVYIQNLDAQYISIIGNNYYIENEYKREKEIIEVLRSDLDPSTISYLYDQRKEAVEDGTLGGIFIVTSAYLWYEGINYDPKLFEIILFPLNKPILLFSSVVCGVTGGVFIHRCFKSRKYVRNTINHGVLKHNETFIRSQRKQKLEVGLGIQQNGIGISLTF